MKGKQGVFVFIDLILFTMKSDLYESFTSNIYSSIYLQIFESKILIKLYKVIYRKNFES